MKNFVNTKFVIAILMVASVMMATSCQQDDDLLISNIEKVSLDEKKPVSERSGSANIPGCSDGSLEQFMNWSSSTNLLLATNSNAASNKKYIWKQSTAKVNGKTPMFKVYFKNKANYPITVRAVSFKRDYLPPIEHTWVVQSGCVDLNTNGSNYTFDMIAPSNTDHIQFEVIIMNKNFAGQPTRTNVPIEVKVCTYFTNPCF